MKYIAFLASSNAASCSEPASSPSSLFNNWSHSMLMYDPVALYSLAHAAQESSSLNVL